MTLHALLINKSTLDIVLVNVLCKKSVVFELIMLKKCDPIPFIRTIKIINHK